MNDLFAYIEPWHIFFAIGIVLLALEMLTNTFDLLSLGVGALAGAFIAWLDPENIWLPILTSAVVAVVMILLGSRWKKNAMKDAKGFSDPIDSLVNQQGKVIEAIAPQHRGIVRIGSEMWSAASTEVIAPGELVIIIGRSSTVLEVRRA